MRRFIFRKDGTGFHASAIEKNGASAAITGVTADVRAREIKLFAQQLDEQEARLDGK